MANSAMPTGLSALPANSELNAARTVGHRMLDHYGTVDSSDIYAYAQAHGGVTEALRLLLRALDAEMGEGQ